MARMQLAADRFAVDEDGRAFDLATGARVSLKIGSAGGVSEQLRWTEHCDSLRGLHHRATASLVDFGLLGEASRFEAWSGGHPERDAHHCGSRMAECGLRIIEQPAVRALAEMFEAGAAGRPHVSALYGPCGAGKGLIAGDLARIARTKGYVPVAARLIASPQAELWRGRSLFVIADANDEGAWTAFLTTALTDPEPHVLLLVGEDECRSIGGVAVCPLAIDALVSAVQPSVLGGPLEKTVRRAAERSRGLPGRFARLLWPEWNRVRVSAGTARRSRLPRVAEQTAVYGVDEGTEEPFEAAPVPCAWPAPGELAALRRKMEHATADLARGRQAAGIRQLRQAVGSLARRGAWSDAARGALALAAALLRRGRTRDAHSVISDGRDYASRAGEEATLLDLAVLSGEGWIDLGRLDEADSVLGTALAAARVAQDPARLAAVSLALARASYWRGAYADAEAALAGAPDLPSLRVRRGLLTARIAVGHGDLNRAMSLLAAIPETSAAIASVTALVHLAVGDLTAAERDLSTALALARTGRDPQRAMRARLLRAEVDRARGRPAVALVQLHRLGRVIAAAPPIVRARWDLAKALSSPDARASDEVSKHVRVTGLRALPLYVADQYGPASSDHHRGTATDPFADELVAILRLCQSATDEIEPLNAVCGRLRHYLHAASVAFMAVHGERVQPVTSDGARMETDVGERAAAAGITIAPHRLNGRIEAAVPIEYGGAPIGVLCARWTLGSTYDTSRAASVLTLSAAAAAPMVAAVLAREARADPGPSELLGVTPVMAELRQSVARAAAAPFAVLIDGESGSGKELVARAIHRGGTRRNKPFCTLNCAALPDDLVEAELFGHTRGAFTGAIADRAGVFEEAHGGTLFLDEIGELTPRAQAKVLRVIQDGELRRVGENVSRRVDVRIVAATNRALRQEVEAGRFRLDLWYRLDVVHIAVPPLRDRREDIAVLVEPFWRDATARVGSRAALAAATIAALARYDWPGNVRELQNVLAALAVRAARRGVVSPSALPPQFAVSGGGDASTLEEARRTFEHRFVRAALVRTGGHRGRAAAELGVTRQGLTKLMSRLGIQN